MIFSGVVLKSLFHDYDSGYTVLSIRKTSYGGGIVKIKGKFPNYGESVPLYIEVNDIEKDGYEVNNIKMYSDNISIIANYLKNNCCNIGKATAEKVAKHYGENIFELQNNEETI